MRRGAGLRCRMVAFFTDKRFHSLVEHTKTSADDTLLHQAGRVRLLFVLFQQNWGKLTAAYWTGDHCRSARFAMDSQVLTQAADFSKNFATCRACGTVGLWLHHNMRIFFDGHRCVDDVRCMRLVVYLLLLLLLLQQQLRLVDVLHGLMVMASVNTAVAIFFRRYDKVGLV